jgi:hypothetical protein
MKTKNLLTVIGAAALVAITIKVNAGDALLSPRDAGNQIKQVSGTANDVNRVTANNGTLLSPRAAGGETTAIAGMEITTAAKCRVIGSPKYMDMAGKSARMSCCNLTLAECATMDNMPKAN